MGDSHVGLQARLMSQALRKLTATVHKSNTTLFFINQIRMKIGVMFGSPETTTGGNALKFYASQRLDIRRVGTIKQGEVSRRQPRPREGREEQARAALRRVRVRHPLRQGHQPSGDVLDLGSRWASSRSRARGTAARASASARAATTRAQLPRAAPGDLWKSMA
jgi:recombination protein RecA